MPQTIHPEALFALVNGNHGAPFDILGPHSDGAGTTTVRAFRPDAAAIMLVANADNSQHAMKRVRDEGLFEIELKGEWPGSAYHYRVTTQNGHTFTYADPYAFPSQLTDYDIYLLREGRHLYSYEKMGAHLMEIDGVKGVQFAVWAPNAFRMSVVGTFNNWDARVHPMRQIGDSGIWDLFVP
ncbi:MAG: 1,4-alpha-glucan branching enzyme, partial [Anaerolineae bacterium]|nr:1,4-alpha-glucan branching enzyme [Anaerolineae bacterium]